MTLIRFLKQASQHGAFAGDEMDFETGLAAEIVDSGLAEMVPLSKEEAKEAKAAAKEEAKEARDAAKEAAEVEEAAKEVPGARVELPPPPPPTEAEIKAAAAAEKAAAKEAAKEARADAKAEKAEAKDEKAEAKESAKDDPASEPVAAKVDEAKAEPEVDSLRVAKRAEMQAHVDPKDVKPEPKAKDEPVKGSWNKP